MKHDQLCAIGHNIADSLASGQSFVIGYHPVDVFGEAASSEDGLIEIDFLRGRIVQGRASPNLRSAVLGFAKAFPAFCQRNAAKSTDFRELSGTFGAGRSIPWVKVYVTDRNGRRSSTNYEGIPLKRIWSLDPLGRRRRVPRQFDRSGGE
ncbi:hypothetical protein [Aureimonas sp. D3]|uniref:hypothetical protein n=1 Tax=Aureimonas sp. D3 TaxID=1638164 RepID=UPI000AD5BA3F|nr:hypothetical protein [Aureimonas sp. D3]